MFLKILKKVIQHYLMLYYFRFWHPSISLFVNQEVVRVLIVATELHNDIHKIHAISIKVKYDMRPLT